TAAYQLGLLLAFIEPIASVCRRAGLAERHFRWPETACRSLHANLRWLLAALVIPIILIVITEVIDDDAKRESFGRLTFMVIEMMVVVFGWRVLHPTRGSLADVMTSKGNHRWRLGYLWLPLGCGLPVVLMILTWLGYYYTALQLQSRFFQ